MPSRIVWNRDVMARGLRLAAAQAKAECRRLKDPTDELAMASHLDARSATGATTASCTSRSNRSGIATTPSAGRES